MSRCRGDCHTLEQLGLHDTWNCCSLCHEDDEYYGNDYPLMNLMLPTAPSIFDQDYLEVCCRVEADPAEVLKKLEEAGL